MNTELELAARGYLARDEKLLWSGAPRGGIRFRLADTFLIPFSLLWGGFAIFWEYLAVTTAPANTPFPFSLFGLPFVLIGLYIIFGRFFVDAWQRSRTLYLLTDQRALIVSGLFVRDVKSLPLRSLQDFTLTERADGSGTITLAGNSSLFGGFAAAGWPGAGRHAPPAFEMIEQARHVHELLRGAVADAGRG